MDSSGISRRVLRVLPYTIFLSTMISIDFVFLEGYTTTLKKSQTVVANDSAVLRVCQDNSCCHDPLPEVRGQALDPTGYKLPPIKFLTYHKVFSIHSLWRCQSNRGLECWNG